MKAFIQKIQNSDEGTKKFWLVVFSAVSMTAVIGLWLVYVNVTIPSLAPLAQAENKIEKKAEAPGFFSIFAAGVKIIYDKVQQVIGREIATTNTIIIQNPDINFSLEGVEPIPATKLP